MRSILFKRIFLFLVISTFLFISVKCQDEEEEDDEYEDEEPGTTTVAASTTKKVYRIRQTTIDPPPSGRNESVVTNGNSTVLSANGTATNSAGASSNGATAAAAAPAPAPAAAAPAAPPPPLPPTRAPVRATRATTQAADSAEEETTEEEGLGYIFRPLTNLIDNVVAGNISGIVDNALSIRTPPEIRSFVNNVMTNVFGVGVGSALRQFAPTLFSTIAPPTLGRDPIPGENQVIVVKSPAVVESAPSATPAPTRVAVGQGTVSIIQSKANNTEETKTQPQQQQQQPTRKEPIQLKFTHPGAPASRLRCEIIAD